MDQWDKNSNKIIIIIHKINKNKIKKYKYYSINRHNDYNKNKYKNRQIIKINYNNIVQIVILPKRTV